MGDRQRLAELDDGELACSIATGPFAARSGAEDELCRRLAPRIRAYGLRHLRDPAAAADLVQDVLLMVLEKLRSGAVREPGFIGSFALGVCRQLIVDQRRTRRRREHLRDVFQGDLTPESATDDPITDAERLRTCLERLAERDRTVVVMSFFAELTAEAIGADLGLTAANVRVIRHRAVHRLRECVHGPGDAP